MSASIHGGGLPCFDAMVRRAIQAIWQEYQSSLKHLGISIDELPLLFMVALSPCSHDEVIAFLAVVGDGNTDGVFQRAIRNGYVRLDGSGRVLMGDTANKIFDVLMPAAERFNLAWRAELQRAFRPEDLSRLLAVLKQSGAPLTVPTGESDGG